MKRELIFSAGPKDFRIETKRGTGPGGQARNKTESCVRITHIESGLSAQDDSTRSQHQNKIKAFRKLCRLLLDRYVPKRQKERAASGNVVVRTYHGAENRVKDHATGLVARYGDVLDDPSEMIQTRAQHFQEKNHA